MRAVMSIFAGPMSRTSRRVLIILGLLDLALLAWLWRGGPRWAWRSGLGPDFWRPGFEFLPLLPAVMLVLVLAAILIVVRLYAATAGIAYKPDHRLDERQRALRDRATQISYRLLMRISVGLFLLSLVAPILGGRPSGAIFFREWYPMLLLLFGLVALLVTTLPTLVVSWLEPDPVRDERRAQSVPG